jgi:single-strand DNA-binding protein
MANLNKVMLIGRLTRDPEVRTFSNGGKVAKIGFAVNNRRKNPQSGQWEEDPVFLDCEVFNRGESGRQADLVEQSLHKGSQVFLEGHLKMDNWTDKEGQKRSKLVLVVDNFQFLDPRADGAASPTGRAPAPRRHEAAGYSGGYDEAPAAEPPARGQDEDIPF